MAPEQKQRSLQLIADWSVVTKAVTPAATYFKGEQMAALLQELVDAPAPSVSDGMILVRVNDLQKIAAHAKIAANNIVDYAKAGHTMYGWLDDSCTHADIAAQMANDLLAAAPTPAEGNKCIWCGKDTKLGHEFNCRLKESAKEPEDVVREADRYRWLLKHCAKKDVNNFVNLNLVTVDVDRYIDAAIEREKLKAAMCGKGDAMTIERELLGE